MSEVRDNQSECRFELAEDGALAFAKYLQEGDAIVFTHTIVPEEVEGRGVGGRLVKGALDLVRDRGLAVVPNCSFVRSYIERHPEYRDLVAG
jgi:hypothetical protein